MAVFKIVSGQTPASGSLSVDYTIPGFGVPDAAIVYYNVLNAPGQRTVACLSTGFIASNNQGCVTTRKQAVNPYRSYRKESYTTVLEGIGVTGETTFTSGTGELIQDGLRITYSAYAADTTVQIVLIKNIKNASVNFLNLNTTSTPLVVDVGFKPSILFGMACGLAGVDHLSTWHNTFGIAHNSSIDIVTQASICTNTISESSVCDIYLSNNKFIPYIATTLSRQWDYIAENFTSTGYSVTASTLPNVAWNPSVICLALELNDPDSASLDFIETPTSNQIVNYSIGMEPTFSMMAASLMSNYGVSSTSPVSEGHTIVLLEDGADASIGYTLISGDENYSFIEYGSTVKTIYNNGNDYYRGAFQGFTASGFDVSYDITQASAKQIFALSIGADGAPPAVKSNPLFFGQDF